MDGSGMSRRCGLTRQVVARRHRVWRGVSVPMRGGLASREPELARPELARLVGPAWVDSECEWQILASRFGLARGERDSTCHGKSIWCG